MFRKLWARYKPIAQKIGDFQARVILTVLYFLLLGPAGLFMRFVRDPLNMRRLPRASVWVPKPAERASLETARRQF